MIDSKQPRSSRRECSQDSLAFSRAVNLALLSHHRYNSKTYSFKSWILPVSPLDSCISALIQTESDDSIRGDRGRVCIQRLLDFPLLALHS